jgi:DNA-binding MarR family transcriptional regulator
MGEVLAKGPQIEAIIEAMSSLWNGDPHDVPGWVAQELTFSQMRLLFLLSKKGPAPMSRIAEWLGVGLPTASGTVERVERHGLVTRRHRLDDRRVVECMLTDAGRRLIDEIYGMRLEMMRQVLGVLNEDELGQMARLMTVIAERGRAEDDVNTGPSTRVIDREGNHRLA